MPFATVDHNPNETTMSTNDKTAMDKIIHSVINQTDKMSLKVLTNAFVDAFGLEKGFWATMGVVRYTMVRLALGTPAGQATVPLSGNGLCPVSPGILTKFAESIANNCQQAIADVRALVAASPRTIGEYIKRGDFVMQEEEDDEFADNDPVNGCYVNAQEAALQADILLAQDKHDKIKEAQINQERVELLQAEADQGNPLAIFYLGVCYFNASGVEKDASRSASLLVKAEMMGVKRASQLLFGYFG